GHGLISPHHLGYPHTRERFFIVGCLEPLAEDPFPERVKDCPTSLVDIVLPNGELSRAERGEVAISARQLACINHWNQFIALIPSNDPLPSFPIWGDEIDATYPFLDRTPFSLRRNELLHHLPKNGHGPRTKRELLEELPSYART